jgi:hypothetical protein
MLPDLTRTTDKDLALYSEKLLCVVRIFVPQKQKYTSVLGVALASDYHARRIANGTLEIIVAYKRESILQAQAFFESIRVHGWFKAVVFANGRMIQNKHALNNWLACYLTASQLPNPKAHCHVEVDNPFPKAVDSLTISLDDLGVSGDENETWLLPCAQLQGFLEASRKAAGSPQDRLLAVAQDRTCNLCPLFDAEPFSKIGAKFWR